MIGRGAPLPLILAIATSVGTASGQEIVLTTVWESEESVLWLGGLASVDDEYWALDAFNGRIHRFAESGGPGEFVEVEGITEPLLLGGGPDGTAIYDGATRMVHVIRAGRTVGRFDVGSTVFFPKDVIPVDGHVILAAGIGQDEHSLHILSHEATPRHLLRYQQASQPLAARMVAGGVLWSDGSEVLFAQSSPHLVARVRLHDAELDTIVALPEVLDFVGDDLLEDQGEGDTRTRWFFPQARGIVRLRDDTYLHVIRRQEEGTSLFEIFTRDGRLMARTYMEKAYDVWDVLDDGTLLASYYVDGPRAVPVRVRLSLIQ